MHLFDLIISCYVVNLIKLSKNIKINNLNQRSQSVDWLLTLHNLFIVYFIENVIFLFISMSFLTREKFIVDTFNYYLY